MDSAGVLVMDWTPEQDEKLRDFVAAHKTRRFMAEHFGVNIAAIGGRVYRLGLTKPNGRKGQPKKKAEAAE